VQLLEGELMLRNVKMPEPMLLQAEAEETAAAAAVEEASGVFPHVNRQHFFTYRETLHQPVFVCVWVGGWVGGLGRRINLYRDLASTSRREEGFAWRHGCSVPAGP
jgi:hypothetical protein